MDDSETIEITKSIKIAAIAGAVAVILIVLILIQHSMIKNREGRIVLPAGETYLGPTPESQSQPASQPATPQTDQPKFTASPEEQWKTVRGRIYQYYFSIPQSLELVTFDDDPYDIYAIKWNNLSPSSNVLIGVDNLNSDDNKKQYLTKSTREYVQNWWKQFGALKGVSSIEEFTNSRGMRGYTAYFLNQSGQTPFVDVFFEVPGRKELVIHMANGVLDNDLFLSVIDSVGWGSESDSVSPSAPQNTPEE